MNTQKKDFGPLHPGEVLMEDYLVPAGISQTRLALNMRVSPQKINDIVNGKRAITADTALRLGLATDTTPEFWLSLQMDYDLQTVEMNEGTRIEREVLPLLEKA
jgi:addiction module HigA family antidote